ncbi:Glycosyl hydrolase family 10 protein [Verrucomicrobiia bacterium DG1235]|nr:Glycosyl hydrolase family 10 protein [Verrucomicrobiae bacterium DG1235]
MKLVTTLIPGLAILSLAIPAAAQDIAHRKAGLTVQVQTGSGTPLEGATVEIEMLNHAFRFGCAVEHQFIDPSSSSYDPFTVDTLQTYFNSATYGNIMKWTYYEDRTDAQNLAIAALPQSFSAFDGPDKLRLRGHVTVWGASYQVPNRVRNSTDGAYISEQILDHVFDYHTTYKNSGVDNYDLYNEHFNERDLLIEKIVTNGVVAEEAAEVATWFNKAKEADPAAILFINDYNVLNDWTGGDTRVVAYKEFVDAVRDAGGQIDGIGLQAHMDRPTTTKTDVTRRLDILAAPMAPTANHPDGLPGLRLEITELDMSIRNRFFDNTWGWPNPTIEDEVAVTQAVLEGAFEHPAVDGITVWGIDDFTHWRGNSIMFDNLQDEETGTSRTRIDPVLKETGQLYIDKVLGEWWQDHSGASASSGAYTANTFKGTHRVTVTFNGETQEEIVTLSEDDTLTVNFAAEAADATTYDAWAAFITWGEASNARTDDPDQDGRSNLHEFVFGTHPLAQDTPKSPRLILADGAADFIKYTLRARNEGLDIQLAKSTNLVDWTPIQANLDGVNIGDGLADHTLRFSQSDLEPTAEEGSIFYRIQVAEAD